MGVHKLLPLLGGVVLGIFTQVAKGDGALDFCRQLVGQFVFERPYLFFKLFGDVELGSGFRSVGGDGVRAGRKRRLRVAIDYNDPPPIAPSAGLGVAAASC